MIENISGKDVLTVLFETPLQDEAKRARGGAGLIFKAKCGCTPDAKGVPMGELPRSEKKRSASSTAGTKKKRSANAIDVG